MNEATRRRLAAGLRPWNHARLSSEQRAVGEAITQNVAQALYPNSSMQRDSFLQACGVMTHPGEEYLFAGTVRFSVHGLGLRAASDVIDIYWEEGGYSGHTMTQLHRAQHVLDGLVRGGFTVKTITKAG